MTVQELMRATEATKATRFGCFIPRLRAGLRCIQEFEGEIGVGDIVYATMIDVEGHYANTVHLEGKIGWWPLSHFELAE